MTFTSTFSLCASYRGRGGGTQAVARGCSRILPFVSSVILVKSLQFPSLYLTRTLAELTASLGMSVQWALSPCPGFSWGLPFSLTPWLQIPCSEVSHSRLSIHLCPLSVHVSTFSPRAPIHVHLQSMHMHLLSVHVHALSPRASTINTRVLTLNPVSTVDPHGSQMFFLLHQTH